MPLYQGVITIQLATGRLEPLCNYQGKTVRIPACAPAELHLLLGFLDDEFDDNGYYEHNDGPEGQCMGPGRGKVAWVVRTIDHTGSSQGLPAFSPPREWDLNWIEFHGEILFLHSLVVTAGDATVWKGPSTTTTACP